MINNRIVAVAVAIMIGVLWTAASGAAVITGSQVNCRAAPRLNAFVLAVLNGGDKVAVLSHRESWAYVDPANAAACWVEARFLREDSAAATAVSRAHRNVAARKSPVVRHRAARGSMAGLSLAAPQVHRKSTVARKARVSRPTRASYRRRSSARMSSFSYGGSCPCSGGNICIGPRGGRYCITSGGNKRYGM